MFSIKPNQFERKSTFNERLYAAHSQIQDVFIIQFILIFDKQPNTQKIYDSFHKLSDQSPIFRMKLEHGQWKESILSPNIVEHLEKIPVDPNHKIFTDPIDKNFSSHLEIDLFQNALLVRVDHALMDGTGALDFLYQWFDILNGANSTPKVQFVKDHDFRDQLGFKVNPKSVSLRHDFDSLLTKSLRINSKLFQTFEVNTSKRTEGLISKVACWYGKETNSKAKFLIPVNLRRHLRAADTGNLFLSNLSLPIYLHVQPNQSEEEIKADLLQSLLRKDELSVDPKEKWLRLMSTSMIKRLLRFSVKKIKRSGKYPISGFLSDLGYVDLNRLSTEHFKTIDFKVRPTYSPLAPFCMFACHHKYGTRVGISVANNVDAQQVESSLSSYLKPRKLEDARQTQLEEIEINERIRYHWESAFEDPLPLNFEHETYINLAGSSLNLLLMLTNIGEELLPNNQEVFISKAIVQSGKLTLHALNQLAYQINPDL